LWINHSCIWYFCEQISNYPQMGLSPLWLILFFGCVCNGLVIWGSISNVVGLTRLYALPLTTLSWAQIPNLRSMTSCVISLLERLAHFRQLVSTIFIQHIIVVWTDCELFIARSPIQVLTTLNIDEIYGVIIWQKN
jgi:hypothetical protein